MPPILRVPSRSLRGPRGAWGSWCRGNVSERRWEGVGNMGKKMRAALEKVQPRVYALREAVDVVKSAAYTKFDESVDLAIRLGIDPKRSDQMVRGTTSLPHGTGKKVRVLVFAKGEKEQEARQAGADYVGSDDLMEKIKGGWMDFDCAISTPDLMGSVGKLGKVLGPRGLMPNPKTGTVTFEVGKAVREIKAGKVEFRVDKTAIIHAPVGKVSFGAEKLLENAKTLIDTVIKARPAAAKGRYVKSIALSSTMGPGVRVDLASV